MTEMKIPKDVVYGILKVPIPVRRSQIRKTMNKGSGDPNLAWHIDGCDKCSVALQGGIDSLVIQGMNMGGGRNHKRQRDGVCRDDNSYLLLITCNFFVDNRIDEVHNIRNKRCQQMT